MAQGAINAAMYSTLTGDATIAALIGTRCYLMQAPEKTPYPYVIFSWQGGGYADISTGSDDVNAVWRVEAVSDELWEATALEAAIKAALEGKALTVSGYQAVDTMQAGGMWQLTSIEAGVQVYRIGAMYRIKLEKSAG